MGVSVALTDIVLEGATILVNRGDPCPALEHEGPCSMTAFGS